MPRLDGTGPMGWGSMTGRGFGYCAGVDTFRYARGFRRGFGRICQRLRQRGFTTILTLLCQTRNTWRSRKKSENQLKAINEELENL